MSFFRKLVIAVVLVVVTVGGNAMSTDKKAVKEYNKSVEYVKAGKLDKAEKHLLKALKRDGTFYEAHLELGKIYYSQNKLDDAATQMQAAYNAGGKKAIEALDYLYAVETKKNNLDGRVKYALMKVKDLGKDATIHDIGRVDALAVAYAQNRKMSEAEALYEKLMTLRPDYAYSYLNLGKIYLMTGQPAKAYPVFQRAIDNGVDNAEIDFRLGGELHDRQQFKKALPLLAKASKDPKYRQEVLPLLINCNLKLKHFPEALEECRSFLKEFPASKLAGSVQKTAEKLQKKIEEAKKAKK
ncbi:MAG: tetratricopeptide repeat protein [Acidobacteria bacterium]|nr:tetratricopeptide repeat protein [Acidobacteriota bacterium]